MPPELEALLDAAIRAPSGDNTQPWRFAVAAEEGAIEFSLDETRDPSPMNSGQRMARIALGAAIENFLQTAQAHGWESRLEPLDSAGRVRVKVSRLPEGNGRPEVIAGNIRTRV